MRIFDRYILGELAVPFVSGILFIIMTLIGNTLYQLLDLILKNHIPLVVIVRLAVFNIPTLLVLTMPVGVAVGASYAVNRMGRESELTSVRMAGVPLVRIFMPIMVVALIASIASFEISEHVVPSAQKAFDRTQAAMFGYALAESPNLAANRVFVYQNYEFYVGQAEKAPGLDGLELERVVIIENPVAAAGMPRLITARTAYYSNGLWTLHDVLVHLFDDAGFTRTEAHAASMTLDLRVPLPNVDSNGGLNQSPDSLTMHELGRQIVLLTHAGLDSRELEVSYYFKLAMPFLCLAFGICAPPLSLRFARTGSFVGIFLSIVMVFVAWNTLLLFKALGLHGYIPPIIAAWFPDVLFAAFGMIYLWRME